MGRVHGALPVRRSLGSGLPGIYDHITDNLMNAATIMIIAIIVAAVVGVLVSMRRKKGPSCGCGCGGCAYKDNCSKKDNSLTL